MNRKGFIKTCGYACLGVTGMTTLLESCASSGILNADIKGDDMIIPLKRFEENNGRAFKKYIVVQHELLLYPICVYRLNSEDYTALWMKCTHQGATLQVFGDKMQCPAHGSEFSNKGDVDSGPAIEKLRSFPVKIEQNQVRISLKAI